MPSPRPASLSALFWSFTFLALQGFGGVLAIVQREVVERHQWLTKKEFLETWAVAQVMPGPNVVNLSVMLGNRFFGWRGALVATAGMLAFPLLAALSLLALVTAFSGVDVVMRFVHGVAVVASGLIAGAALKLIPGLAGNPLGRWGCAAYLLAALLAAACLRWPLLWVIVGIGGAAWAHAYWLLQRSNLADRKAGDRP